ncbi:MAG TPA: hypothetical protein PLR60_02640 [Syntrophorhabdaceae bacterium]|nr:hypothetical protein [Syntrophorhabdaceae bacterium]
MKIIRVISIVFVLAAFFCSPAAMAQTVISTNTTVTPGTGDAAVDRRLSAINEQAKGDLKSFVTRTSSHFGVPSEIVEGLLNRKMPPADAYMTILLSHITKKPVDNVVEVYDANKGKGWGVIAKQMGIKPGSAGFHALKKDNFALKDKGKGKGKEKAKGKGKSKGKWADGDD